MSNPIDWTDFTFDRFQINVYSLLVQVLTNCDHNSFVLIYPKIGTVLRSDCSMSTNHECLLFKQLWAFFLSNCREIFEKSDQGQEKAYRQSIIPLFLPILRDETFDTLSEIEKDLVIYNLCLLYWEIHLTNSEFKNSFLTFGQRHLEGIKQLSIWTIINGSQWIKDVKGSTRQPLFPTTKVNKNINKQMVPKTMKSKPKIPKNTEIYLAEEIRKFQEEKESNIEDKGSPMV